MRKLAPALIGVATVVMLAPPSAAEPVLVTDTTSGQPPFAATATCVATGAAPGVVTFAVYGTSNDTYTIAACVAYQNGVKIADFGGKRLGPVAAFTVVPRQVGAGRITVSARTS